MSYTCTQHVLVLEDSDSCNRAFQQHIIAPGLRFIGLDCEWNTDRPISLLQVATPTVVMLIRICSMHFIIPPNVRVVLEDPNIYKVGVNIENDSTKLNEDCRCFIKSWVDLRFVAIRCESWIPCVVSQIEKHESELRFYAQSDPASDSAQKARGKRLSWSPKMGLESLINDCMDMRLPKNSSARWNDNWEADYLQENQLTYAANDATASLDIFTALVFSSHTGSPLPVSLDTHDVHEIVEKYSSLLESTIEGIVDEPFLQRPADMLPLYKAIEVAHPDMNLGDYYTKSSPSKNKAARKVLYSKKKVEAPITSITTDPGVSQSNQSESLETSRNSFTFDEITTALKDTKSDSKCVAEDFVNAHVDAETGSYCSDKLANPPNLQVLFHFCPVMDRSLPVLPGYSYGRGSRPPHGYRRFRRAEMEAQTDFDIDNESQMNRVTLRLTPVEENEYQKSIHTNTVLSYPHLKSVPVTVPATAPVSQLRTETPAPPLIADDEGESISSCSSSTYLSCSSKQSKSKGRGRGRGNAPATINQVKTTEGERELKKGRGRGRGAVGPKPDEVEVEKLKITYASRDIRYQDCPEDKARPSSLSIEEQQRNPTSSFSSVNTHRDQSADATPTNTGHNFTMPQDRNIGRDDDEMSGYSTFSCQNLMQERACSNSRTTYNNRSYSNSSQSNRTYNNRPSYSNSGQSNYRYNGARDYGKPSNQVDRVNQNYEFKTTAFRQATANGLKNLHTGIMNGTDGWSTATEKEEPPTYDWATFRKDCPKEPEKQVYTVLSDSEEEDDTSSS